MFSMAVAAMRKHRFAAVAALVVACSARPRPLPLPRRRRPRIPLLGRQRLRREPGGERGPELGRTARGRLLVLLRRDQLLPGLRLLGLVMEAFGHAAGIWLPHST